MRIISILEFGASYIRDFTVIIYSCPNPDAGFATLCQDASDCKPSGNSEQWPNISWKDADSVYFKDILTIYIYLILSTKHLYLCQM